jgi:hypothetical protein
LLRYSLSLWFLEQEKVDDKNSMDDDATVTFTIEKNKIISVYVIYNFRINYQKRPNNLNNISAYEFASTF